DAQLPDRDSDDDLMRTRDQSSGRVLVERDVPRPRSLRRRHTRRDDGVQPDVPDQVLYREVARRLPGNRRLDADIRRQARNDIRDAAHCDRWDDLSEELIPMVCRERIVREPLHDALFHRDVYAVQVEWTVAVS